MYYYNISGQMKAFLDRINPLLLIEEKPHWDIYLLMTAQENKDHTFDLSLSSLEGWSRCFLKARIAGHLFAGDTYEMGDVDGSKYLDEARTLGAKA